METSDLTRGISLKQSTVESQTICLSCTENSSTSMIYGYSSMNMYNRSVYLVTRVYSVLRTWYEYSYGVRSRRLCCTNKQASQEPAPAWSPESPCLYCICLASCLVYGTRTTSIRRSSVRFTIQNRHIPATATRRHKVNQWCTYTNQPSQAQEHA